ncbi:nucleoside diphosphate kinase regulator [Janthinobacterium fluminis]|uniref:Nucleoside diphosphate kinase regulator n=1 Tax=Janthinobacterium fluminis TaxID=2987524 RepID=A0ABT5K5P1_9BURK|nr:nucleoside diphosphate kinase regulator [Janthinobacterium fluminis]MDC8759975.1 nucleoside diphosphate kinase regulator [Janthinobacterium fluminis]
MDKSPKIILSSQDLDRLETLLYSFGNKLSPDKAALLEELGRAEVLEPQEIPPTVVTMNSTVRFTMEDSQEAFCMTLVYPKDLEGGADRISVLAPVGSALLGLSVGDSIAWPRPGGGAIKVQIVEIVYQPERAGEFHR